MSSLIRNQFVNSAHGYDQFVHARLVGISREFIALEFSYLTRKSY